MLEYRGLEKSSFPFLGAAPQTEYIEPGMTAEFKGLYVNTIKLMNQNIYPTEITREDLAELSFLYAGIYEQSLTEEERSLIAKLGSSELISLAMYRTRSHHMEQFVTELKDAKQTEIKLSAPPVMGDLISSSQLGNPFLGSIGIAAFALSQPPVDAQHTSSYHSGNSLMYGLTRGDSIGHTGLARIGGGHDHAAAKTGPMSQFHWNKYIHTFAGYAPINLLSLER
jgi:hypothetical protein